VWTDHRILGGTRPGWQELERRTRTARSRGNSLRRAGLWSRVLQVGGLVNRSINLLKLQRRAQFRSDFVNAENSMGFHAPQEAARILGEAIDYARQGQLSAARLGARR